MVLFTFSKQNSKHSSKLSPTKRCVLVGGSPQKIKDLPKHPTNQPWKCHKVWLKLAPHGEILKNATEFLHCSSQKPAATTPENWKQRQIGIQKLRENRKNGIQKLPVTETCYFLGGYVWGGGAGMAQEFSFGSHQLVHCFPKIIKKDIQNQNILLVLQSLPPNRPERKYKYITYLAPLKQTGKYLGFKD